MIGNFDLQNIELLHGGTNTPIYKGELNTEKCVIKQYGYFPDLQTSSPKITKSIFKILLKDYLEVRKIMILSNLKIPKLLKYYFVNSNLASNEFNSSNIINNISNSRLVFIEEYCGDSLRNILRKRDTAKIEEIINLTLDYISKMPLELEFDVNPANFTFKEGKIFFVDFMPPKIEKYQNNTKICELFPQIRIREIEREKRRQKRYKTLDGRIERFNYYLSLITQNPQNT